MLTVWACFLHKGLSFLEKKACPSRFAEQTWQNTHTHTQCVSVHTFLLNIPGAYFRCRPHSLCECRVRLHLPHTRSRCRARWSPGPPGTCPRPRWGSRSRGSWFRTGCSSLCEQKTSLCAPWQQLLVSFFSPPPPLLVPFSQYGCPSSMWNMLFPMGCWQATQTKQDMCQVCFRAFITCCTRPPPKTNNSLDQLNIHFQSRHSSTFFMWFLTQIPLKLGDSPPESCAGSEHRRGRSTARSNAGSTAGLSPPRSRSPPARSCSGHRWTPPGATTNPWQRGRGLWGGEETQKRLKFNFLFCEQKRKGDLPNDILALVADGSAGARWHVLRPLQDGVEVLRVRLRGGPVLTFRSSAGDFAEGGTRSSLWETYTSIKNNRSVFNWRKPRKKKAVATSPKELTRRQKSTFP